MWNFDDIGQFSNVIHTFGGLEATGTYYNGIVSGISPTINFMYDTVLTNPIFIGLIVACLVLSLFTFGD